MNGVELITSERHRQIDDENWTSEHDDAHTHGELAAAGSAYAEIVWNQQRFGRLDAQNFRIPQQWPWSLKWWKPSNDPIMNLVKAGALIAAEIDRLKRK